MSETDRAAVLRDICAALVAHRKTREASAPANDDGDLANDDGDFLDLTKLDRPLPPLWQSRMQHATKDGITESLYASIREEGWRAFVAGGTDAMERLALRASAENPRFYSIIDHRWDDIGIDGGDCWHV